MKIDTPTFVRGKIVCGVYKIVFDDSWFYIGSSSNLRGRFNRWRVMFRNNLYISNKNILNIMPDTLSIKFSIIESGLTVEIAREKERDLIKNNWENSLLLNRCPDTTFRNGTKGLKPYNGYVKPIKKKQIRKASLIPSTPPQKVARFDKDLNLIEIHPSKSHVEKVIKNCTVNKINKYLKGECGSMYGFKFKLVLEDGSFLEPPLFKTKKGIDGETVPKFYQLDLYDNIINEFTCIEKAARFINGGRSHISDVLRKYRNDKTVKGFKFEYADSYHERVGVK